MRHFSFLTGFSVILANCLFVGFGCSGNAPAPKAAEEPKSEIRTAAKPPVEAPPSDDKSHKPKFGGKQEAGAVIQATYLEELSTTEMPQLVMSVGHAAMCKVKVGDDLPDATMTDLAGKPRKLSELRGQKLTVVPNWWPFPRHSELTTSFLS